MIQIYINICLISSVLGDSFGVFYEQNVQNNNNFTNVFEWSYVNFTWNTIDSYTRAIQSRTYIPENVMLGGIKFYANYFFIALPKHRSGVPVTLAYLSAEESQRINPLLTPFPSWEQNDDSNCDNLQSVISMEVDTRGIMWVIDGVRVRNNVQCPPKLVLINLHSGGQIHTYSFPDGICLQDGGFLNDIVIDETSGGFAYITDNSNIDPGIIIYSRIQNRAWKLRDKSMFADRYAANFVVDNYLFSKLSPVDGIALSPKSPRRTLFYSQLTAYSLYGIDTEIIKNEELCRGDAWRNHVQFVGLKESQTDGMLMDTTGNLYYTLIPLYGVRKWNIFERIENSKIIFRDEDKCVWPEGFSMDDRGNLYLISSRAYSFVDTNYTLTLTPDIKFVIFKVFTGTRSYLYNDLINIPADSY